LNLLPLVLPPGESYYNGRSSV